MAPVRVGIIGLSIGGWAPGSHLAYLKQSSKYVITAICNTSKASSENAIKHHGLPDSTKAYGSPEELASDPNVDLVVVSVRTDRHGPAVRPAIAKGKACYVEWPLGKNLDEARELNELAKKAGIKTIVGLQSRRAAVVNKIKETVESGRIGRVLSSTVTQSAGNLGETEIEKLEYLSDSKVGGNVFSIHFAHSIDFVLYTLGGLSSYSGIVSTQRKETKITGEGGEILRAVPRDTPDQITLHGRLRSSGGVLTYHLRGGPPFKGEPGICWRIYGEKGEIYVTSESPFLHIGNPNIEAKVHDHATGDVQALDWADLTHHEDLPAQAQNVAGLYEAFADGKTSDYLDWDGAVDRHQFLYNLEQSSKTGIRKEVD